ncbi:acyl-CoA dehydrogenase family protein [Candidatus Poriferisocius sp.]|uniref:acyl-CoA dehydrogenase family protein n=1 Tax=Candidatus Poriferisocius sp. TaxID=3101276 RepID=UPI003B019672
MDPKTFRQRLEAWLDTNAGELTPPREGPESMDAQMAHYFRVKRALHDAGFGRYGWPESVGGLGGSPLLRAIVGEEINLRNLADPNAWTMIEVLAPTVIDFAPTELAASVVPPFLRGEEMWCQGFSEPDAGSDLAALSCRATRTRGGWVVTGQKVWTSFIQYSRRCVLLTRTGEPGSAHRGITALLVDVDSPGLSYSPIQTMHGKLDFAEVHFHDVFVPEERLIGEENGGWRVAMDILPYERSTTFWHRGALLHRRCSDLVARVAASGDRSDTTAAALGRAFQSIVAFRSRSCDTQHRLASGEQLGVETSIDKLLIASAEQQLFETARDLLPGVIEFDDDLPAARWRTDYLYSKAATIYGGTAEIQHNIIARRLLDLGPES